MLQNTDTQPLVLIVDDDCAVRESLAAVMEAFGFRARIAGNGAEGLAAVALERPAAIITDLQMPQMTGLELISALRRTRTGIPIIAISGGDVEAARHSGAAAAFHKPLPIGEVIDTVCGLTQRAA